MRKRRASSRCSPTGRLADWRVSGTRARSLTAPNLAACVRAEPAAKLESCGRLARSRRNPSRPFMSPRRARHSYRSLCLCVGGGRASEPPASLPLCGVCARARPIGVRASGGRWTRLTVAHDWPAAGARATKRMAGPSAHNGRGGGQLPPPPPPPPLAAAATAQAACLATRKLRAERSHGGGRGGGGGADGFGLRARASRVASQQRRPHLLAAECAAANGKRRPVRTQATQRRRR